MLSIRTNILAWNAGRQFGVNTSKNKKTTEKLSSGYRINRSADDAAGLAISEKMRRQIRGLTQAKIFSLLFIERKQALCYDNNKLETERSVLMTAKECIKGRRSIRSFTTQPVDHALLSEIIETASYAPSWKHTQITRYNK